MLLNYRLRLVTAFTLGLLACGEDVWAELRLPHLFSDHMVLQRNSDAAIWGKASPGAEVTVTFKGTSTSTTANGSGSWTLRIGSGEADAKGAMLTVEGDGSQLQLRDVVVGEVWLASGQSNMVFTMDRVPAYSKLIEEMDQSEIRMFNAPMVTAVEPQDDIDGEWTLCHPETTGKFSAVAFFFASKLHEELGVPVGVIKSAWGGKPVETFTSREALLTLPGARALVEAAVAADAVYDPARAQIAYVQRMEQWKTAVAAWRQKPTSARGRAPRRPAAPKRPLEKEGQPGVLFNSMINPLVGYTLQGAIWYQGESNAKPGAVPYNETLPLMIRDWRTRWNDDFSFYFVQLANFREPTVDPGSNDPWPLLQDRMRQILDSTPKTGMAIINDIGEAKDIHPKNKHDVGKRLALWALAKDYQRDIVHCGPLFAGSAPKGNAMLVTMRHVGNGLKSRDGKPLQRFEVAGTDRTWHWAQAEIVSKDTVRVSSDQVDQPVAVRYAWAANPDGANLVNSEGLPASVFRTDRWNDALAVDVSPAAKVLAERRALGQEIKAIAAQRAALDRTSKEFKELATRQRKLLEKFRAMAPASNTKQKKAVKTPN